jgi:hypothetical protein
MKTINYSNTRNFGGIALDKRSRDYKYLSKKEFNTPDMQRIANEYGLPIEVITLRVSDLNIFHNFETGILGNQLN